jgi:hypothetical protein
MVKEFSELWRSSFLISLQTETNNTEVSQGSLNNLAGPSGHNGQHKNGRKLEERIIRETL